MYDNNLYFKCKPLAYTIEEIYMSRDAYKKSDYMPCPYLIYCDTYCEGLHLYKLLSYMFLYMAYLNQILSRCVRNI